MTKRIIILGAAGRIGRVAAEAFRDAGWDVASLVRGTSAEGAVAGTHIVEVDARDSDSVVEACQGADVILHALNPQFADWSKLAMPFADTAIAAARASGATLVLPGNIYNYGANMPAVLDETTPMRPTSRKGTIRVEIEDRMRRAAQDGVRGIVLRAGDFYGGNALGSWFDRVITRYCDQGRLTFPGPIDLVHEWAYLPDVAKTLVRVVEARANFTAFETFGFPGHAVTGRQFLGAIQRMTGRKFNVVSGIPWLFMRLLSPLVPTFRELSEISYLWQVPHRIDGAKLASAVGDVPHTPLDDAIATALREIGLLPPLEP